VALANITVWKKSKIHSYEKYFVKSICDRCNSKNGDFTKFLSKMVTFLYHKDCHFCIWKKWACSVRNCVLVLFLNNCNNIANYENCDARNFLKLCLLAKSKILPNIFCRCAVFISTLLCIAREVSQILTFVSNFFFPILFCLFASPNLKGWVEKLFHSSQAILMTWISFRKNTKNFEKEKSSFCKSKQKY